MAQNKKDDQTAVENKFDAKKRREGYVSQIKLKSVSQTRSDISTMTAAFRQAGNAERPRRARLHHLYRDIKRDAHLTSQMELRTQHVLGRPFVLKDERGEIDEESTQRLMAAKFATDTSRAILETIYEGDTLVELSTDPIQALKAEVIPRTNLVPEHGLLLLDENDDKGVKYREVREFGSWLLEFGDPKSYGMLEKAIPHVLFKRFSQSCWSELCEIYGIPPRYLKTDTTDPAMLDRAEAMLRDMGAAAWFIIDTTEEFQFAKGADTNGDVYNNLIRLCNNENSILISGAVIGQDTEHGNESKEASSMKLLDKLIQADSKMLSGYWNTVVCPALFKIGYLPGPRTFEFTKAVDPDKLWKMITEIAPHKNVDNDWLDETFGIKVTDKPQGGFGYQLTAKQGEKQPFFA